MTIAGIALLLGLIAAPSSAADSTYFAEKMQQIMAYHLISEEGFYATAIPITNEYVIASQYETWRKKGKSEDEMVALSRQAVSEGRGKTYVLLRVGLVGGVSAKGRQSIALPVNLKESVLIVTDARDTVVCAQADVPFARAAGLLNSQVEATLTFPAEIKRAGRTVRVMENGRYVDVIVKGLGMKKERIRYALPISGLFYDAPAPLKRVFAKVAAGG